LNDTAEAMVLNGVTAGYGSEVVLDRVSLTVPRGDFLGIIGPNGGGKTTLLNVLLGLVPVRSGSVSILGEPPSAGRRHIGYVPQSGGHDPGFPVTVREVACMGRIRGGNLFGRITARDREIVSDSLEKTGMLDLANKPMGELSMGQRQRVLFARALAVLPSVLLLDEPTASVDGKSRQELMALLDELNRDMTIVMVSHDMSTVDGCVRSIACVNRTLHLHADSRLTPRIFAEAMGMEHIEGCPVELLAHGPVPHRVVLAHDSPECCGGRHASKPAKPEKKDGGPAS